MSLENDTYVDIVITTNNHNALCVLLGYEIMYPSETKPYGLTVRDLNNDNQLDIVFKNSNDSIVEVVMGSTD